MGNRLREFLRKVEAEVESNSINRIQIDNIIYSKFVRLIYNTFDNDIVTNEQLSNRPSVFAGSVHGYNYQ